ncbi:MAG: TrkA family potassium uptake protein [Mycoplasmataceae bacterium]|nr:TrkA family potassium uptake protein [Mycoplasmataceae bacterium]
MSKKEVVIIGIGRFAKELINRLNIVRGYSIVAIDNDNSKLEQLQGVKNIIVGDATNETFIKNIGIEDADFFVIGMGQDFQSSLVIASLLKENFKGVIIAKSVNTQHELILRRLGVDDVVTPEVAAAKRTFNKIVNPLSMKNEDEYQMNEITEGVSIVKIPVIEKWENKEIKDISFHKEISIALIFKNEKKAEIVRGSTLLEKGDMLAIAGKNKTLIKLLNDIDNIIPKEDNNE